MYISLGQLTSKVPRLCYSTSDFYSSCGVLQLLSYHNASTTSKPITSELNKQIADVFGLADLENFAWHILSLSYYNASTTSKPITSELNKQIADVFGLADLENFAWHILSLYLHCRDREKCDVTLPGSKMFESP